MADMAAARLIISGRVQGVFFRMETQRAAKAAGVSGWVRNLPDGNVEALLEGLPEKIESVIAWCRQGPPRARVEQVEVYKQDYSGVYEDFSITR